MLSFQTAYFSKESFKKTCLQKFKRFTVFSFILLSRYCNKRITYLTAQSAKKLHNKYLDLQKLK